MINSALLAETIEPGLTEVLMAAFEEVPEEFRELFKLKSSDKANEDYLTVAGLGSMPSKAEGQGVQLDEIREAYKTTLSAVSHALGVRITREALADQLYGLLKGVSAMLGVSGRDAAENSGGNIFNRGFNDSYVGGDSEPLFGDNSAGTHPLKGGGTERNTLSTQADLSVASLNQALIDIRGTVNDRGLQIVLRPEILLVSPSDEKKANQLIESEKEPFTAENQINTFRRKMRVVVNDYLTDTDAWFILCKEHKLIYQEREKLNTMMNVDPNTGDMIYLAFRRFVFGWKDWRGVFGSQGA